MSKTLLLLLAAGTLTYNLLPFQHTTSSLFFVVAPPSTVCGCNALNSTTTAAMHADGVPAGGGGTPGSSSSSASRDACIATCTTECLWANYTKEIVECYSKKYKSTTQTLESAQPCSVGVQCLWGCWEDSEAAYYGANTTTTTSSTPQTSMETTTMTTSGSSTASSSGSVESTTMMSNSSETNNTNSSATDAPSPSKHDTPADSVLLQCAEKQKCCQSLSGCQTTNGTFCDAYTTFYRSLDECLVPYEPTCAKACTTEC